MPPDQNQMWLTISKIPQHCTECSSEIPKDSVIAFRYSDQGRWCALCIDRLSINAKPSKRYLAATKLRKS